MSPQVRSLIPLLIGIVAIAIFLSSGIKIIQAGSVGVVTRFGATTGRVLEPGAHIIIPFAEGVRRLTTRAVIYETSTEDKLSGSQADYKDFPVDTNTSDGQQVDIFYTVRFSIDPSRAVDVVNKFGSEVGVVDKIVKTESRIWARNIPRDFKADDLYTGKGSDEAQIEIAEKLRPSFETNGLYLDAFGIREIRFSNEYVAAIEAKQIEAVKVETEKNRAEQAKYQKEQAITQAEAQAEAQRLQRETISGPLLEKLWIEKWDGKLPTYMTGEAQNLIQIPGR